MIPIEVVGETWGPADDAATLRRFRACHAAFPALARVDRTRFARHAADICWLKRRIQGRLGSPEARWLSFIKILREKN